ncbi:MAG TPA: ABC transporter ATP-binding protein [Puia sp.]|jgi:lipoprotein-releasing system ATP-binding protein|nr:ABC transporter ATP-binding protein [Puia sp.]
MEKTDLHHATAKPPTVLQVNNVVKYFYEPEKFQVLKDVSFSARKGEFLALVGKSGSGKSTLLYVLSTMDTDYEGRLVINDEPMTGRTQNELSAFRNKHIGFVFQFHYLLPEFTVLENIMIPALKLKRLPRPEIEHKAYSHLENLGLKDQALKLTSKLSGGQQQRAAIARALINDPSVIMGDEPTGNLDSKNSQIVFDIFRDIARQGRQTIIAVTHDEDFAANCDRVLELSDGRLVK